MSDRNNIIWRAIRRLPLVDRLYEVPADSIREARSEILMTTIFATMPFWFPIIGLLILNDPPSLLEGIRNGELLIYAATLVGPLAYIITKRYGNYVVRGEADDQQDLPLSHPFPNGRMSVTVAMIICIISGIVVTLQKVQGSSLLNGIKLINTTGLAVASIILFILSTILLFCVSAYRNFIEHLSQDQSRQISRAQPDGEDNLARQWRDRREEPTNG